MPVPRSRSRVQTLGEGLLDGARLQLAQVPAPGRWATEKDPSGRDTYKHSTRGAGRVSEMKGWGKQSSPKNAAHGGTPSSGREARETEPKWGAQSLLAWRFFPIIPHSPRVRTRNRPLAVCCTEKFRRPSPVPHTGDAHLDERRPYLLRNRRSGV
jgi:hypothetical protein